MYLNWIYPTSIAIWTGHYGLFWHTSSGVPWDIQISNRASQILCILSIVLLMSLDLAQAVIGGKSFCWYIKITWKLTKTQNVNSIPSQGTNTLRRWLWRIQVHIHAASVKSLALYNFNTPNKHVVPSTSSEDFAIEALCKWSINDQSLLCEFLAFYFGEHLLPHLLPWGNGVPITSSMAIRGVWSTQAPRERKCTHLPRWSSIMPSCSRPWCLPNTIVPRSRVKSAARRRAIAYWVGSSNRWNKAPA